jgi:acetoacetate decarboxylase
MDDQWRVSSLSEAGHEPQPEWEEVFSFPWDAPLVPPFPIEFRNVSILTVSYRTDPAAIERLLPPPLVRVGDTVLIHIYQMRDVDYFGAPNECNVMVGARLVGPDEIIEGGYSTWLFLDSDGGIAHGREVHGQPKKLASVRTELRGDLLVGTVERNGIRVITATMPYKQRRATRQEMLRHFNFVENINFKLIPHIDGRPAIRQLTARSLENFEVLECWGGPCTVELRPNAQAPVFRLPVIEPLTGYYWTTNFTLVGGRVIHDYLR